MTPTQSRLHTVPGGPESGAADQHAVVESPRDAHPVIVSIAVLLATRASGTGFPHASAVPHGQAVSRPGHGRIRDGRLAAESKADGVGA